MRTLLVFVPGAASKRARYRPLLDRLVEGRPDCVVKDWDSPITVISRVDLVEHADNLRGQITNWLSDLDDDARPADEVVLIGHSVGGLVAREAYLQDLEQQGGWHSRVSRLVLLATPNRGIDPKQQMPRVRLAMLAAGWLFSDRYVWKQSLRGSSFVTNLRVRWIREFNRPGFVDPHVVQLRVPDDPMVHPGDSRDVELFPNAGEGVVSGSTHANIASLDGSTGDVEQRLTILRRALFGGPILSSPEPVAVQTDVALMVHGIRSSNNGWPERVEAALQSSSPGLLTYRPSYGYLTAYAFALPLLRRSRRRWIRDVYSGLVARHPTATFHYVGHSNGTYLFGKLLETVSGARFESAYLGGCVLARDFAWDGLIGTGPTARVERVLNVRGSADVPVGWLCSALRGLGMRELGTAGLDGFTDSPAGPAEPYCLRGGHGVAFADAQAPARIASWVIEGTVVAPPSELTTEGPSSAFGRTSRVFGEPFLLGAMATCGVLAFFWTPWVLLGLLPLGIVLLLRTI